jgi:hypothetical protein
MQNHNRTLSVFDIVSKHCNGEISFENLVDSLAEPDNVLSLYNSNSFNNKEP